MIVPAWNAARTLDETLQSAAAQTHRNLEILIVDDGSTDATAAIAVDFCASESRARLIGKPNGGVAAARNRGIDEAKGDWIAPLDADDLWHPDKIARQLQTFAQGSPQVGFVYCWYRMIDDRAVVTEEPWSPVFEGEVFGAHLRCSFGTGSSPLIRRSALGTLRYDVALQRAGNQGSEDWLLQLQIAADFEVACTRAFLLGYRTGPANMSSDSARMMRSHMHMLEIVRGQVPRSAPTVRRELARWRARHGVAKFRLSPMSASVEIVGALARAPLVAGKTIASELSRRFRAQRRLDAHPSVGKPFLSLSPDVP